MKKTLILTLFVAGLMAVSFEAGRRTARMPAPDATVALAPAKTTLRETPPPPASDSPAQRQPTPPPAAVSSGPAPATAPTPPRPAPTDRVIVNGRVVAQLEANGKELRLPARGVYIPQDNKLLLDPDAITGGRVSVGGGERSKISFTNNTDEDLYLFWVDYSGRPTFSDKLRPGQSHAGISSVGQVHVITKTNGDVFGYIEPIAGEDNIDIER